MNDWSLALYADHAPELSTMKLDSRYTFGGLDLRAAIASVSSSSTFPLNPYSAPPASDLRIGSSLSSGALQFIKVNAASTSGTNLIVTGLTGVRFPAASSVQVGIMRLR
jgi:hypothetical protein